MSRPAASDEALAAWAARGEMAAFETLYERHAPWIRAWAAHTLGADSADDVLQEVFVRVWRAAPQFDPARGQFMSWLAAITRHYVARELSRRGGEHQALAAASVEAAIVEPAPASDEVVSRHERQHVVLEALRRLPADQRHVVVLAYFAGMSQSQMAAHLGIPLGTVKKRVRLATRKLRLAVEENGMEGPTLRVVTDR